MGLGVLDLPVEPDRGRPATSSTSAATRCRRCGWCWNSTGWSPWATSPGTRGWTSWPGWPSRRQQPAEELLQLLSPTAAGARCALICVPHPCGHPINFKPLADALAERTDEIVVWGLELPGHAPVSGGEFVDIVEAVRHDRRRDRGQGRPAADRLGTLRRRGGRRRTGPGAGGTRLRPAAGVPRVQAAARRCRDGEQHRRDGHLERRADHPLHGRPRPATPNWTAWTASTPTVMGRIFRHDVGGGYRYLIDAVRRRAGLEARHPGHRGGRGRRPRTGPGRPGLRRLAACSPPTSGSARCRRAATTSCAPIPRPPPNWCCGPGRRPRPRRPSWEA